MKKFKELFAEIAQDNMAAFEEFYNLSYKTVYAYVYGITHHVQMTQDAMQITYTNIWKSRKRIPLYDDLRWVLSVAKNSAINTVKKSHYKRNLALEAADEYAFTTLSDIDETAEILSSLNENEKFIVLSRRDGYSYKDVEYARGWPVRKSTHIFKNAKEKVLDNILDDEDYFK